MNISNLRTFLAVIDSGSFSAAARSLGISQPAVTMQLQALESDLGTALLDRRYRRVDLTEAGAVLEPHARQIVCEISNAREDVGSLSGTLRGTVKIAASTTPGVYVVPKVLGPFIAEHPHVTVSVVALNSAGVIEAVESGLVHIGVSGATLKGARAIFTPLVTDELVAICPPGDELASRKGVTFAELLRRPWVVRESGSGTQLAIEKEIASVGLDPNRRHVVAELSSGGAVVVAVEGGLGVAMVSARSAERSLALGRVARVNLAGPPVSRQFHIVLPKGTPTRAAAAFATHIQKLNLQ